MPEMLPKQGGSAGLIPTGGTSRKQTTQKHTTKRHTTPQSKTVTCTITVECKNIHKHMSQLKSGHERFVPNDGYIIHTESRTVDRGSTAYDVLKLACSAHGIRLTAKSTSYGVYVVGINNLDEKDCGSASGWMYKFNHAIYSTAPERPRPFPTEHFIMCNQCLSHMLPHQFLIPHYKFLILPTHGFVPAPTPNSSLLTPT